MASTVLTWDPASGSVTNKWTYSVWCKRGQINGLPQSLVSSSNTTSSYTEITFNADDTFIFYNSDGGFASGKLKTTAQYKDCTSWYHFCVVWDPTNVTATDRIKIYVNGVEPAFTDDDAPSTGQNSTIGNTYAHHIGGYDTNYDQSANSQYFVGYMAQCIMVNGYALAPTVFGSFDGDTGEWKPKGDATIRSAVTWSGNCWLIPFSNSSYLGYDYQTSDRSGTTNDFTVGGSGYQAQDNPSNNFCVWNSLDNYFGNNTFTYGNTVITQNASYKTYNLGTLGMANKGKYYWESMVTVDSNSNYVAGIQGKQSVGTGDYPADHTNSSMIDGAGGIFANGVDTGDYGSGYTTSSILSVAYDALNNFVYYGKDGTWLNSGDPTSGASGTGGFDPGAAGRDTVLAAYLPCWGSNFTFVGGVKTNFGNGYFGATAITSAGTNASGNGTFEYDVPTGYTALCTKGINSF